MWVFLNNAFLSIVQDKDDPSMLMVRARLRGDIQRAFSGEHHKGIRVTETPPPADYRFRARIDREVVARRLFAEVLNIDYTNFKKSVPDIERHNAYLGVWNVMWRAQEDRIADLTFRGGVYKVSGQKVGEATAKLFSNGGQVDLDGFDEGVAPSREYFVSSFENSSDEKPLTLASVKLPPTTVRKRTAADDVVKVNRRGKKAVRPRSSRHRK